MNSPDAIAHYLDRCQRCGIRPVVFGNPVNLYRAGCPLCGTQTDRHQSPYAAGLAWNGIQRADQKRMALAALMGAVCAYRDRRKPERQED